MNKQEIFDKVAWHLITQNKAAKTAIEDVYEEGVEDIRPLTLCSYWDQKTNLKCAIGCLIPEDLYNKSSMEGKGSVNANPAVLSVLQQSGIDAENLHMRRFLFNMQLIHDTCEVSDWKKQLRRLANDNALIVPDFLLN